MGEHSNIFILQLNLLATVVLLSIAAVLFFRRNNVKANIFLGLLLLYPATTILTNIAFIIFRQHQFLFLGPVSIGFNLTFGPVLLTYLHFMQGKEGKAPIRSIAHFVPAFLVFASAVYYIAIPEKEQIALLNEVLSGESVYINLINLFLLLHVCVYLVAAWRDVKRYSKGAAELEIPDVENAIKWQKSLLACIITINISLLLAFALPVILTGSAHIYSDLIAAPACALLIYGFMIHKGSAYHVIYNQVDYRAFTQLAEPVNSFVAEQENVGSQPVYKEEFIAEQKTKLLRLFDEEKIFTKPGLKLHDVAAMLDISPASLSFIINKQLKMTFFEMMNQYRVAEAQRLFASPEHQHYKIESIGQMSGFNSKASFFSVFKKLTGTTPQAFKEELTSKKTGSV